jgi:hypothetical protein
MARFTLSIGLVVLLVAGGTWLHLSRDSEAGPRRDSKKGEANKETAVQDSLLPYASIITPAALERDYTNMRVTPYNDPRFYFELTVPRSFESQPLEVSLQQRREDSARPVPMAEFAPDGDKSVLIEARYVRVPQKVTLDRFMAVYAEKSGFEIVRRQRGDFEGRKVEEALLRVTSPEFGKTLTRLTISRRGDLLFMVAGSCPEADYPRWKQAFAVAAISFSPTGK